MTWNMLVTQAAYSFAQVRGRRIGKISLWFSLIDKAWSKPSHWLYPSGRPGRPLGGAGSWWRSDVDGEVVWSVARGQLVRYSIILIVAHALQHARNRAWTQPSEGLCSVPSKAALSLPELVELFHTLLARNAAGWWYSNSVSGAFVSLGAIQGVFTDITLTRHQKPHSQWHNICARFCCLCIRHSYT